MAAPVHFERRYDQSNYALVFHYESFSIDKAWLKNIRVIKNGSESDLNLSQIWVNGHPASYLPHFTFSPLPEKSTLHVLFRGFEIKTPTESWDWYQQGEVGKKKITITLPEGNPLTFEVIIELSVLGLKWMIYKRAAHRGVIHPELPTFSLILDKYPLSNENTLEECLPQKEWSLRYKNQDKSSREDGLQKGTGTYSEGEDFRTFCAQIPKKADLACKLNISNETGTGLLIGNNRILTVAHLFPGGTHTPFTWKDTVTFLFGKKQELKLMPTGKLIALKPTPEPRPASHSKLDLALFEVTPPPFFHFFSWFLWKKLNNKAKKNLKNLCQFISSDQRMNIVHYPEIKGEEIKDKNKKEEARSEKVTFRKNKVLSVSHFDVHTKGDTDPASSGAPSFNDRGELMGIHYISECYEANSILFKHWGLLLEKLGLGKPSIFTFDSVSGFKGDPELKLYINGENKGFWERSSKNKKHLWTLIQDIKKFKTKKEAFAWASKYVLRSEDLMRHVHCNISINANAIADFLKSVEKTSKGTQKSRWSWLSLIFRFFLGACLGITVYGAVKVLAPHLRKKASLLK